MQSRFQLICPMFDPGTSIPASYTCKGANISPPLSIYDTPEDAASLALILHDPDAPGGDYLHWIVWNISPDTTEFPEGAVPVDAIEGLNGFGRIGYGGPCPSSGTHRYVFDLFALDTPLDLSACTDRKALAIILQDHTVAQTQLVGTVAA